MLPTRVDDENPADPTRLVLWARTLRERRETAGLSRAQLAERTGLSPGTIKNLEHGRNLPTRDSLLRLAAVPELGPEIADLFGRAALAPLDASDATLSLNCWLAPEFDSLGMVRDLVQQLRGRGGHVEQTYLYLDHLSAAAWCAMASQEGYALARAAMPLDRVAAAIQRSTAGSGLNLIGLGAGDGKDEVKLAQHLLGGGNGPGDLRLYLLDISQPLLSTAYRTAADALADRRGVAVFAIQGNFHHLPRYTQLLYRPERSERRLVATMFGNTFANLENEIRFVRSSLVGFRPGDLFLLNVPLTCAPADDPDEIRRKDPRLSGRLPSSLAELQSHYDEWITGPLRRYLAGVKDIELTTVLDTASCPIPGSYAAEVRATVRLTSGEEKQFSVYQSKRYDEKKLVEALRREGWDPVEGWRYAEEHHPRLLYLFQKAGKPASRR
jgi:transcriptional regulator with XRE-family HTH domain